LLGDSLALLMVIGGVLTPFHGRGDWEVTFPVVAIATAMGIVLFGRRRTPVLVVAVIVLLDILLMVSGVFGPVLAFPLAIALYSVAVRRPRNQAWLIALIAALALMMPLMIFTEVDIYNASWIAFLAVPAFAVAAGSYSRSHAELLASTEERARVAEESREAEAKQRVAEERMRIARDLHDVVAHQIAAISLHAELAEASLIKNSLVAKKSLQVIKDSARQGLHDIADLMKVLRESNEDLPSPSLKNLDELLQRYRDVGLEVSIEKIGDLGNLPAAIDSVAFRVIQEGLTNAGKHSMDSVAQVKISRANSALMISITNRADETHVGIRYGGFGLIGIRERASSVGGSTNSGMVDGDFELAVTLPLEARGSL
jgi:signal transduction histidine kinase